MKQFLTFKYFQEPRPPPKSVDPAADYQEGASHVLSVIHEILAHHRKLENKWHAKKIKLHQRLALRLFQEDVKQVLDWLEKRGEVFLRKNVGIGKNLQKARAYQKSHETFEGVVQVSRLHNVREFYSLPIKCRATT